jgi:hypothetical protein
MSWKFSDLPGDRYLAKILVQWRRQEEREWDHEEDELSGLDLGEEMRFDVDGYLLPPDPAEEVGRGD